VFLKQSLVWDGSAELAFVILRRSDSNCAKDVERRRGVSGCSVFLEDAPVAMAATVFLSWCKEEKLDPAAMQIGQVMADLPVGHDGCSMKFGEDASISSPEWDSSRLKGKKCRTLRARRSSALHENITVREAKHDGEIPFDEAERVSDAWLATKISKRKLLLLTRTLPATDEPGVRKFFAFQNDQVVGMLVCDPVMKMVNSLAVSLTLSVMPHNQQVFTTCCFLKQQHLFPV
jgi:lysylphosphatidylglycerol synthetase-like protein (DUF2156 family)